MGENNTAFVKLFKKAAASKKFRQILNEQIKDVVETTTAYRCPGCNLKVTVSHSVGACVQSRYQDIAHKIQALEKDTRAHIELQQRADKLRSSHRHILH